MMTTSQQQPPQKPPQKPLMSLDTEEHDFLLMLASLLTKHRRESDALIIIESLAHMTSPSLRIMRQLIYHRFRAGDYEGTLDAIQQWTQRSRQTTLPPAIALLRCKALKAIKGHRDGGDEALGQALQDYVVSRGLETGTASTKLS